MAEINDPRVPAEEEIRERAYEIYLSRGCEGGQDIADWLTAEQEFRDLREVPLIEPAVARAASAK